ncbi:MAG TPA: peroxiredoxin [Woeseiaceae bacterium]|nr:peroxiredoxin [Woeseiaceae bacterium]
MLVTGSKAPEFVLPDQSGRDVALSDLLQSGPLLLYFYPADFTRICTREACEIRDRFDDIQSVGLNIAGISPQDVDSHQRFHAQHRLPFTLLCDPGKVVIEMYQVSGPLGIGVRRASYLIEQDRSIKDSVLADVRLARHVDFIERAIALREAAGMKTL